MEDIMTAPEENPGPTLQNITEDLNKTANKHRKAREDMNNGADIWAMKRDRYRKEIRAKKVEADAVKKQRDAFRMNSGGFNYSGGAAASQEKLNKLYEEMDKLNAAAEEAHNNFVLCKEAADIEHKKFVEVIEKIRQTRDNLSD